MIKIKVWRTLVAVLVALNITNANAQRFRLSWDYWADGVAYGQIVPGIKLRLYWAPSLAVPRDQWQVVWETTDLTTTSAVVEVPDGAMGFFDIGYLHP